MKHKDKLTMARRLRTKAEVKADAIPFQSETWMSRKITIKERVKKNITEAMARAKKRKKVINMAKKKPCPPTGPAHDGRGKGTGRPGGSRRGKRK